MDINRMRLGLIYIFNESKDINKNSKLQIIGFIENATEHQLKTLALDGEIINSSIDENTKEILDARFKVSETVIKAINKASILALKTLTKK